MTPAEIALVVLVVLAVVILALSSVARRLDRLHRREARSRATLEAQLVHRAEAATALTESDLLDPASALILAEAGWRAAVTAPRLLGEDGADAAEERGLAESELTRALRAALGPAADQEQWATTPESSQLLARLATASYRVQLARRFHNDAVVQIRRIRRNLLVRFFHLAGRAPLPQTFEMDDELTVLDPSSGTSPSSAG